MQHELVHANDDNKNGPLAMTQAMKWLDNQTADTPIQLAGLLASIPGKFGANLLAGCRPRTARSMPTATASPTTPRG